MRLIDADALETHEQLEPCGIGKYEYSEVVYKDDIDNAPPIEPELTEDDWKLIRQMRSNYNGTYAKVIDKLIASAQPKQTASNYLQSLPISPLLVGKMPSAQPELTDDRAIEHLQSTGWMQNHDKEMYEMGLKEQLADDSGSYDSLIPYEDTISRQDAIELAMQYCPDDDGTCSKADEDIRNLLDGLEDLPSAQPETGDFCTDCSEYDQERHFCPRFDRVIKTTIEEMKAEQRWIPCSDRLPEESGRYLISVLDGVGIRTTVAPYQPRYKVWTMTGRMAYWKVIAWMPLPESYRGANE